MRNTDSCGAKHLLEAVAARVVETIRTQVRSVDVLCKLAEFELQQRLAAEAPTTGQRSARQLRGTFIT